MLAKYFSGEFCYSPATHSIRHSDHYWQGSEPDAQAMAHELTRRQFRETDNDILDALDKLKNPGAQSLPDSMSKPKAERPINEDQTEAYQEFIFAKAYQQFAIKCRDSKNVTFMLKESRPMLEISPCDLDANCFALCTPEAAYDLRKGIAGVRERHPEDLITKITSVFPNYRGQQIWLNRLDLIFQSNQELIDYAQMICDLVVIGKVYVGVLIIVYGDGRNGKSTFWNVISKMLGLYPGNIFADTLTIGCCRNIRSEMVEVKGKKPPIAAGMQEDARLDDSTVRQPCFIDSIFAEKKYKDSFSLRPCHTLVLYINHLSRVSASDDGIQRRLIVIPLNAKVTGGSNIKNYSEYLYDNVSGSILMWVIESAKKVVESGY